MCKLSGFVLWKGEHVGRVSPSVSVEVLPEVDLTPYHCCYHCVENVYIYIYIYIYMYVYVVINRFMKFCYARIAGCVSLAGRDGAAGLSGV